MNNRTFIEKTINNEKEDLFSITSYINALENTINDGATFF